MNISKDVLNGNYRLTLHLRCPRKLTSDAFPTKFKHFAIDKPRHNTEIRIAAKVRKTDYRNYGRIVFKRYLYFVKI